MKTTNKPRIMLFCPVRQDPETLREVLRSHAALKGVTERWYYDDSEDPDSSDALAGLNCLSGHAGENEAYIVGSDTHRWTNLLVSRIARIRNLGIVHALKHDFDALMMVDSDLILHPNTVRHLYSTGEPIVSEVFWSQWRPGELWMPNVWDFHPTGYLRPESITQLRDPGLYRVGGLGACTLIRREVLQAPTVRYEAVTGLENIWGEDRWFSVRATCAGFPLAADTHLPPFHIYRSEQLEQAREWSSLGCPPGYFRDVWLTDAWKAAIHGQITPARATGGKAARRLALCLPGESFSSIWMMNVLDAFPKIWHNMVVKPFGGYSTDPSMMRQAISKAVLEDPVKFDYVLWVDDDNVPTYDQIDLMVKTLETYPDISMVAGWCHCAVNGLSQQPEHMPVSCGFFASEHAINHLKADEIESAGALVKVDWTGFPLVLMRGELLAKVGWKAFQYRFNPQCEWGFFGEDVSFSRAVSDCGGVIVVDPRLKVPHLKLQDANPRTKPIEVTTISPGKERANSAKES